MKLVLKRVDGVHFEAITESGSHLQLDGAHSIGGKNKGARPMEAVLAGLGGCSAMDVMSILRKSRQQVSHCEIVLDAERADAVPAVFTRIHVHYDLYGDHLNEKKVTRAVSLSMDKYCSVTKMLEHSVDITYDFSIHSSPVER